MFQSTEKFKTKELEILQEYFDLLNVKKTLYDGVKYWWFEAKDSSILGAFYWQQPDYIFVKKCDWKIFSNFDITQDYIEQILPTIIHELTHRKQFYSMGKVKYISASCRWWNQFTIEPEAERAEAETLKQLKRIKR